MATYEIEIKTSRVSLDVGSPGSALNANLLEVYNGKIGLIIPNDFSTIPGNLNVGDTLIVRLINDLPYPSGIHWHGIELHNNADGTPVTQEATKGGDLQVLGGIGGSPVGGTYLYKFQLPRPGIFWFHPHHFHSTNRVFRGTYGMLIVTDPNEAALIPSVIPDASNTEQLVLSDITVCAAAGNNTTFDPSLPWAGGGALPVQPGLSPADLCEISPVDETGGSRGPFPAGEVPNLQRPSQRINEGKVALTNGRNAGGRAGSPTAPGSLAAGAFTVDVQPGQGLRLQILNSATTRYFRLLLTDNSGSKIDLVRIGGEGGLLDNAILEGGTIGTFDTLYETGEILLPPASRADLVAAIPGSASGTLTMWTLDYERLPGNAGGPYANIPTVPVLHLNVTGLAVSPAYSISGGVNGVGGTPLRASIPGTNVEVLSPPTATLLNPATFPIPKIGNPAQDIQLTSGGSPGIDFISGSFSGFTPYASAPHPGSSRYAEEGEILELSVTNSTGANHPFHLHGFSFQPVSLTRPGFPTFTWGYAEYRDTADIPSNYTLTFRVRIEDRVLNDGVTMGGALGRWLFHCHIFFHAHRGMISELVISKADGSEKPHINVNGSWAYAPSGGVANRTGTYYHPDGLPVTISASLGTVNDLGGNKWEWSSGLLPDQISYIYITAEDSLGCKDQTVFRLKVGPPDDGSDNGDPHLHTVDGKRYDFQAVGEFILLKDREGMEVQTRQTPVLTADPIKDSYSELRTCVSLNTAVAARVGSHRIAYQPGREPGQLQFYLDGKPARLTTEGINLDGHRVSGFDVAGKMALRVDYSHHPVLVVTPLFWNSHDMWYLNINISHTHGEEGIMGPIPQNSWLPKLPSGATLDSMPNNLHNRYIDLYKTFADAWRVNDQNSLFVYQSDMSTKDFTDRDWPAEKLPCELKEQFKISDVPILEGMDIEKAKFHCKNVTDNGLRNDCIFDIATTGDETFGKGYLILQEIKDSTTKVQIISDKHETELGEHVQITALVLRLKCGGKKPEGEVKLYINGELYRKPEKVDKKGRASFILSDLKPGVYKLEVAYMSCERKKRLADSTSVALLHRVKKVLQQNEISFVKNK